MFERQVLPRRCEIAGATLIVSTSGGYSVHYNGAYIGYLHASIGNKWNAYVRRRDAPDQHLGKWSQEEAIHHVVSAFLKVSEELPDA